MTDTNTTDEPRRIMLDIETLGLEPGHAVLSIGAVNFWPGAVGDDTFYREIDVESCQDAGLKLDANTLKWWLEQSPHVNKVLIGGAPLKDVLRDFSEYYGAAAEVWANSPSFDCEFLERAYAAVDIVEPWEFRDERCFRTLAHLPQAPDLEREGKEHHALHDAKHQARVAAETLARLQPQDGGGDDANDEH